MSFRYFGKQPFASGVKAMGKKSALDIKSIGAIQSGGFALTGFMYDDSEFVDGGFPGAVVTHSSNTTYDSFVAVYDENLSLRWVVTASSSSGVLFNNVQSMPDGGFICNGYYIGASATFFDQSGNSVLTLNKNGPYSLQPIWVKYDSLGNIIWAHQTSFVGTSDSIADGNLSASSLSYDGSKINMMGWVRFSDGSSDFNFGNNTILTKIDNNYISAAYYTEVSFIVQIDSSTGFAEKIVSFEISDSQPINYPGFYSVPLVNPRVYLNYGSTMSISKNSIDGKSSILGGHSHEPYGYGWPIELFRGSQNSISTTTPFASRLSGNRELAIFVGQYDPNTLNPDWVVTMGNLDLSSTAMNIPADNIISKIHRDNDGNTYISLETTTNNIYTPVHFKRYPNDYQSQPITTQLSSVYLIKFNNIGDVVWFKRIGMSGNVGGGSFYPSFEISGNTLIVSAQVKPVLTWTYSAGDPEETIFNRPVSNTYVHHSKWDVNTGKFLGVDLNYELSTGTLSAKRSSDFWFSGPESNTFVSYGSISGSNFAGNNLANINGIILPSTIANESQLYLTKYDENGVNIDVSVIAKSLISSKSIGGSDISVF